MSEEPLFPMEDPAYRRTYAEEAAMIDASELIGEVMEREGCSAAELARALGVSRSEVSARLAGERNITVRKLAATFDALGHQLVLSTEPRQHRVGRAADRVSVKLDSYASEGTEAAYG